MENFDFSTLDVTIDEDIVIVTIDRPDALNALNKQVFTELFQLFDEVLLSKTYKGVILTGRGERAFVAGADISEFDSLDNKQARALSARGHHLFNRIEEFHIPVVAAVNGYALGGGCELAMACHIRIAGHEARFGQPEVNLGIIPGYGGTQRLAQLIGKGRAMEMILTGDIIDAETAHSYGLANHVCAFDEEVETAKNIILKIAKKAPLAVEAAIKAINANFDKNEDGFEMEISLFSKLAETEDFKEGANAFLEKRKPVWQRK